MRKKDIQDIAALSPIQEGMLFHYLKEPGGDSYFEQLSLSIDGRIDRDRFVRAWHTVVQHNDVLRTCFKWETLEKPVQVILKDHEPDIRFIHEPIDMDRVKQNDRRESFQLEEVPFRITLCTLESGGYELIFSHHHILFDGWSTAVILNEFFDAYCSPAGSLAPKIPYTDYVRWVGQQDKETGRHFWRGYLEGIERPSRLSLKNGNPLPSSGPIDLRVTLAPDLQHRLLELVHTHKITLATVLYAAWGMLLLRYDNSEDVLFGTTVSGRSAPLKGIEEMAGLCINTIPLRFRVTAGGHERTPDMLEKLNHKLNVRQSHETTPPLEIREAGPLGVQEELFDTIVVIENYPLEKVFSQTGRPGMFNVTGFEMKESTHYDLSVGVTLLETIEIDIQADGGVFSREAVQQITGHYINAIAQLSAPAGSTIREFDFLFPEEKSRILYDFNDTTVTYPLGKTIHQLFEDQVSKTPHTIAVTAVDNRSDSSYWSYLSYKELNRQTDKFARRLRDQGVAPGSIIAIKLERSLDMIISILAILKTGGAYLPIDPTYPQDRIDYMLKDSAASFLVETLPNGPSPLERGAPVGGGVCPNGHRPPQSSPPAYIIYTSGTSGRPKGVMVNHSSVLNRIFWLRDQYSLTGRDVILQATSFIFDVSVCELFRWLPAGGRLCFLPPGGQKDPAIILDTIARQAATTADFVPAVLDMLMEYAQEHRKTLELSSLRYVITGVEAVAMDLVNRFNRTLYRENGTVLINAYGPTESTVDVTHFICSGGDIEKYRTVPIGKPIGNIQIHILDRRGRIQPIGVYGELCISGAGLARGYLNNPGLTAERFANPAHSSLFTVYHSGDMARWLEDGNIQFLGRVDRQVKVRGFRVELAEVESSLLSHPEITQCYVILLKRELCAYIVGSQETGDKEIRQFLSRSLPYYMIPAYIVFMEKMPLTAAGKIDAAALPEPAAKESWERYIAPRNATEAELVRLYSRVLGLEEKNISIDAGFFLLGGHSLKAMSLVSLIHKKLKVNPPVSQVFETPDIRGLAGYIQAASGEALTGIQPVEEKEYYPLSSAQKRMFILQGMDKKNTNYNMSDALLLKGSLDTPRFRRTFEKLIRRHQSLRTSFFIIENQPVQRVSGHVEFEFETVDMKNNFTAEDTEDTENIMKDFVRPFDLSRPPLMRVKLVRLEEERHFLLVDMFHIIADGVSIGVFIRDFMALYTHEDLPALHIQYKDFAQWQNRFKESGAIKRQESWWLQEFSEMPPPLNLPLDFPRPANQGFGGGFIRFNLDPEITAALKSLAFESSASLFMVLLAVYYILLWKLGGNRDMVVGSPIAGRGRDGLEGIMGMFVNTLALRNTIDPAEPFAAFLQRLKQKTLSAFENQDYQFEDLVEQLIRHRDPSRHPLFDVVFALHNVDISEIRIPGLTLTLQDYARDIALFDFYMEAEERDHRLDFKVSYCTRLFKHETIEAFALYFREIIDTVLSDKDIVLEEIKISHNLLEPESNQIEEAMGDFGF